MGFTVNPIITGIEELSLISGISTNYNKVGGWVGSSPSDPIPAFASWEVPAGGTGSGGFTGTGLAYDGTDFLVGDFDSGRIVKTTTEGVYVSEIVLAGAPASSVQGVAYDTSDGTYWVCHYAATNGTIRRYNSSGTLLQTITTVVANDGPNGLDYDAANDRVIAAWTNGVVRSYNCTTGALVETITCTGFSGTRADGIALDPASPTTHFYLSTDGATEFAPCYLQRVNRATGVAAAPINIPCAAEDFLVIDGYVYICHDQGYHLSVPDGNRVWRLDLVTGKPVQGTNKYSAVGYFDIPVVTGKQAITGLGFYPSAIILTGAPTTPGSTSLEYFGVLDRRGFQWSETTRATDNVTPIVGAKNFVTDRAITYVDPSVFPITHIIAEGAVTHDGFAFNFSDVSSARRIYYIAVGGDSIDAKVGTTTVTTSPGSQAITGVGLQPVALIVSANENSTADGPLTTGSRFALGASTGAAGWAIANAQAVGGPSSVNACAGSDDSTFLRVDPASGTVTAKAAVTSLDSDGFTINKVTPPGANIRVGYLAISGVSAAAGYFSQAAATGNTSVSGLGFQPSSVLFASAMTSTLNAVSVSSRSMVGIAASPSSRAVFAATALGGGANPSNTARDVSETACVIASSDGGTPTRLATADFVSMDTGGFTINWSTTDGVARNTFYLALG